MNNIKLFIESFGEEINGWLIFLVAGIILVGGMVAGWLLRPKKQQPECVLNWHGMPLPTNPEWQQNFWTPPYMTFHPVTHEVLTPGTIEKEVRQGCYGHGAFQLKESRSGLRKTV